MTAEHPPSGLRRDEPLDDEVIISSVHDTENIYHTDLDCHNLDQIERPRRQPKAALVPSYQECQRCGDREKTRCPKCGEPFVKLPMHMPACDGGESA